MEHTASNKLIASSTPEQSMLVGSKLQNERTLIDRMRTLKATGRIILNLDPGSNDISKLMDFPLEDGDCFLAGGSRPRSMSSAPCTTRIPFYISRT